MKISICNYCTKKFTKYCKTNFYCSPFCLLLDSINKTESGCWIWQKAKGKDGYGRLRYKNKDYRPHRFSYEIFKKMELKNLHVLHKCDTPLCINPDHLFLGTNEENQKDMIVKGRDKKHTRFTTEEIKEIRKLWASGLSQYKLSKIYECRHSHIWQIVHYKIWKHI